MVIEIKNVLNIIPKIFAILFLIGIIIFIFGIYYSILLIILAGKYIVGGVWLSLVSLIIMWFIDTLKED